MSLLLIAGQRLLEAAAEEEVVLVDEVDLVADEDGFTLEEVAFLVLNVVGNFVEDDLLADPLVLEEGFEGDATDDFVEVLLVLAELDVLWEEGEAADFEETMVAACWELKTETIEEATEEVLTEEVEDPELLADLSCGLTE